MIARLLTWLRRSPRITIDEGRLRHIFRVADGHFAIDTAANRRLLLRVAGNPANCLGEDRFGVVWAAQTVRNGSQIWVQIRNDRIINGGINPGPRRFNISTGLSVGTDEGPKS